jgi:hypothetical protein
MERAGLCTSADNDLAVLLTLQEARTEVALPVLVELVKKKGFGGDSEIKAAVWRLVERQQIELTTGRKLRFVRNGSTGSK